MIKDNTIARKVGLAEDILLEIKEQIENRGSDYQKETFRDAMSILGSLYYQLEEV